MPYSCRRRRVIAFAAAAAWVAWAGAAFAADPPAPSAPAPEVEKSPAAGPRIPTFLQDALAGRALVPPPWEQFRQSQIQRGVVHELAGPSALRSAGGMVLRHLSGRLSRPLVARERARLGAAFEDAPWEAGVGLGGAALLGLGAYVGFEAYREGKVASLGQIGVRGVTVRLGGNVDFATGDFSGFVNFDLTRVVRHRDRIHARPAETAPLAIAEQDETGLLRTGASPLAEAEPLDIGPAIAADDATEAIDLALLRAELEQPAEQVLQ